MPTIQSNKRGWAVGVWAVWLLSCAACPVLAFDRLVETDRVLYVAPNGNDAWSGRLAVPKGDGSDGAFATPARALQAARELRAKEGVTTPIHIRLRGGVYRLSEPLVITPADSGTTTAPLLIEAYAGEKPVLSGGREIKGFTVGSDGRWHVKLPEAAGGKWALHQLFVNGQRRFPPRLPRKGYYFMAGHSREQELGSRKFIFEPGQIKPWPNLGEIELTAFHQWIVSRHSIEAVDAARNTVLLKDGAHWLFGSFEPRQRFYLENVAEALGAPGDWYLNRATGELTYCPMPGEEPERAEVIAPIARNLIRFEGDPAAGRFVRHVTLRGLVLRDTERMVSPADMANENQSSVDGFAAVVDGRGAVNCAVVDCEIAHAGEHAIWLREGCRGNRIERCHLHDLGGGGIYIGEAQVTHEGQARAATEALRAGDTLVNNNYIHDGGHNFPAGVGVFIGHSAGNRVTHNEVSNFSHIGISVGRSWGFAASEAHHNQIEFNRVHHIANGVLSDAGGIYMLGVSPGTTIRNNVVHHVTPFNPRLLANGIYLDEGSSQIKVENNLVHDVEGCAFLLHFGHQNEVRNNIFLTRGSLDPFCYRKALDPENQITFERNIIADQGRKDWFPKFAEGTFKSDYNLFWDASGQMPLMNGRTLPQWQALGRDQHSIFADPQFVDLARLDIRLKPGSPAGRIGFVAFDPAQAGLEGTAEWTKLPSQYPDRALADRTQPPPPGPKPIHNDFEAQALNEWPWNSITWSLLQDKRNYVTNEAAAQGKQCLKITTSYTYYDPWLKNCLVRVAFDLQQSAAKPGRFDLQLRDWRSEPYKTGPYLGFLPDGSIDVGGVIGRVAPGTWMHLELIMDLRAGSPEHATYRLRITPAGGAPIERKLPLLDATFTELTWLGLIGSESQPGSTYLDNLICEPIQTAQH